MPQEKSYPIYLSLKLSRKQRRKKNIQSIWTGFGVRETDWNNARRNRIYLKKEPTQQISEIFQPKITHMGHIRSRFEMGILVFVAWRRTTSHWVKYSISKQQDSLPWGWKRGWEVHRGPRTFIFWNNGNGIVDECRFSDWIIEIWIEKKSAYLLKFCGWWTVGDLSVLELLK